MLEGVGQLLLQIQTDSVSNSETERLDLDSCVQSMEIPTRILPEDPSCSSMVFYAVDNASLYILEKMFSLDPVFACAGGNSSVALRIQSFFNLELLQEPSQET